MYLITGNVLEMVTFKCRSIVLLVQVENLRNTSCYVLGVITNTVPDFQEIFFQKRRKKSQLMLVVLYMPNTCHMYNVLNIHSVLISVTDRNF